MTTTAHRTSLADVRATDQAARSAEVERLVAVLAWLEQHLVDPRTSEDVAFPDYGDGELLLAGDGAPAVSEAAVVELVTNLGLSDGAGRHFLGIWLEVRYRLPRLWQRVLDLEVAPWRARRVAESTRSLPWGGADYVDARLDGFAHSLSWAQLERTVEAARVEFDPEEVERRRAADPRHFDVRTDRAGIDGYVYVDGLLDVADALDLDAAVSATAAQLTDLGCEESLDVRRAMAVGEIARAQLALDLDTEQPGRAVTLYVHLSESGVATLDNTDTPPCSTRSPRGAAPPPLSPSSRSVTSTPITASTATSPPIRSGSRCSSPGPAASSLTALGARAAATSTTASTTPTAAPPARATSHPCAAPTTA